MQRSLRQSILENMESRGDWKKNDHDPNKQKEYRGIQAMQEFQENRKERKNRKTGNRWRRKVAAWLTVCMLFTGSLLPVEAIDYSRNYTFHVTVNNAEEITVKPGDTVTLVLSLSRTDSTGPMTMYALSSVLRFNSGLLEMVDLVAGNDISSSITKRSGSLEGWTDITLNYLAPSMSGVEWENGTTLATLTLKAVGSGSSQIQVLRGSVSTYSGMDSFNCTLENVKVTIQDTSGNEEPVVPTDPTQPSTPSGPGGTTSPADPDQPTDPSVPVDLTVPDDPGTAEPTFSDVAADAWYADAVQYVVGKAYFNGTGENRFDPELPMTRAMFVTVLGRIAGAAVSDNGKSSFADVPEGQWFTSYVAWASENGIVTGYNSETFGPEDSVTREQMAAILHRYAKYAGVDAAAADTIRFDSFTDKGMVSDYAREAMIWATSGGIINGMGDATLAPQGTATRVQVAQIIMNFDQKINH